MSEAHPQPRQFSGKQVALFVLLAILVTAAATLFIAWRFLFPPDFRPVELTAAEQATLDGKLRRLEGFGARPPRQRADRATEPDAGGETDEAWLRPEAYAEDEAARTVELTERELNGLIGADPQLGTRLAIDLDEDLASARALIPLDPSFPLLGGRNLRINAGVELAFASGRPVVKLRGLSVMGVPLPNAWLGNMKNVDLVAEFGADEGFWKAFADGVESIEVRRGHLVMRLKE
jgi:hypothetical protein